MPASLSNLGIAATFLGGLLVLAMVHADGPAGSASKLDFNRDIRPILSDNCFACHGPDAKTRKGDLRLDIYDPTHKSGSIIPKKADESEVIKRILANDKKQMPPAKFGKKLTAQQVELLKRWINEGASYSEHWAWVAPQRVAPPPLKDSSRVRNAIDRFVLARLEAEGLKFSKEADKTTLIRRLSFDLMGLPPTPEEVDAFVADTRADAYERLVEKMLGSKRFGEHMARYWLDLARFGDTHGLHLDNYREMWLYRDWVINAFNTNMPYDRFLTKQLAGDLLPGNELGNLIATGFNRAHVTTSEGGSISEEIHIRNVNDRVETTGTVFLGLTVGCAKCHDHKYDPITMKDFYALSGYFNSLEGNPLDGNAARHPPTIRVPSVAQEKTLAQHEAKVSEVRKALAEKSAKLVYDDTQDAKESEAATRSDFVWIDDAPPAGATPHTDGAAKAWTTSKEQVFSGAVSLKHSASAMGQHYFTGANPPLKIGKADKLFAYVFLDPKKPPSAIMLQWHTNTWRHRAYWGENVLGFGADNTAERRRMGDLPEKGKWVRLEVPVARVGLNPGTDVTGWAFTQYGGTVYWDKAGLVTQTPQSGGAYETLTQWLRVQKATKGVGLPADILPIVNRAKDKRTPEQQKKLKEYFTQTAWSKGQAELAPLRAELAKLDAERTKLEAEIPVTYIFRETPKARQAYMLKRGEYDQRGEAVNRATPGFLNRMPEKDGQSRLGLATWMLDEKNPLTARVAVNRYWQQVFGTGLVKTSEDFGVQGEPPSHPELLDWLALEFRESGWDMKHVMRLLLTSATYRQSSITTKELTAKDPENRLLARGPRFRLDAETLRDQALLASGLLYERIGGPSVKPPQPPGLWQAVAYVSSNTANFVADKGTEKVHRRSLYTFWKRTAPPPQLTTFDAPSRESCSSRRERTNTPLQALLLLNDEQYIEAARVLAQRVLREKKTQNERIELMFRLATSRKPDADEMKELQGTLADLLAEYKKDEAAAKKLIAKGETKPEATKEVAELAAWTMLGSTILNLDEVLNKS
jgi:mono/diheme cytochrome c family protein